jgi:hypothetical protein
MLSQYTNPLPKWKRFVQRWLSLESLRQIECVGEVHRTGSEMGVEQSKVSILLLILQILIRELSTIGKVGLTWRAFSCNGKNSVA